MSDVSRNSRGNPGKHSEILSRPPCDEYENLPTINMVSPGSLEIWETPYEQYTNLEETAKDVSCVGPCYTFYKKVTGLLPESSESPLTLHVKKPLRTGVPKVIPPKTQQFSRITAPACNEDTCEKLLLKTPAQYCTTDTCEKLLSRLRDPQQQLKVQDLKENIQIAEKKDPLLTDCECSCKNAKVILKDVITTLANLTDLLTSTECPQVEPTVTHKQIEIPSIETGDEQDDLGKCLIDTMCEILCWDYKDVPQFKVTDHKVPLLDICDLLCWKGYSPAIHIGEMSTTTEVFVEKDKDFPKYEPEISCTPLCWDSPLHLPAPPDTIDVPSLITCDLLCWGHDERAEFSCSVLCWYSEIKSPSIPGSFFVPPLDMCDLICWKQDEEPLEIEKPISSELVLELKELEYESLEKLVSLTDSLESKVSSELVLELKELEYESLETLVSLMDSLESKETVEELEIFESAIDVSAPKNIIYIIREPEDLLLPPDKSEELVAETKVLPKKTVYTIGKSIENNIQTDESDILVILESPSVSETLHTVEASLVSILSREGSEAIIIPQLEDSFSDRTVFIIRKSIENVLTTEPSDILPAEISKDSISDRIMYIIRKSIEKILPSHIPEEIPVLTPEDSVAKKTIYILKKSIEEIFPATASQEITISDTEYVAPTKVIYIIRKSIETILPTEIIEEIPVSEIEELILDIKEHEEILEETITDIKESEEILDKSIPDIKESEKVPVLEPKVIIDKRIKYSLKDMTEAVLLLQETCELPEVQIDIKISSEHILPELKSEEISTLKLEITEDLLREEAPSKTSVSSLTWCEVLCWESMRPGIYRDEIMSVPVVDEEPPKLEIDTVPCVSCFCMKKAISEPTIDKLMKDKPAKSVTPATSVRVSLITEVSITNECPQGTVTTITKAFKETLSDKKVEEFDEHQQSCNTVSVVSKSTIHVGKGTPVEKESTVCDCEYGTVHTNEAEIQKKNQSQYEETPVSLVSQKHKVSAVKEPEIKREKPVYLVTDSRECLLSEDNSAMAIEHLIQREKPGYLVRKDSDCTAYVAEKSVEAEKASYLVKGQLGKVTESIEAQSLGLELTAFLSLPSVETCDILCWSKDESESNKKDVEDMSSSKIEDKKET